MSRHITCIKNDLQEHADIQNLMFGFIMKDGELQVCGYVCMDVCMGAGGIHAWTGRDLCFHGWS